ncbi:penicillin-binding protein 1C [Marinilabiliaceae bacterium JC017]|nr:penicillin-binding protein 1C [Marinilabiliaceae bacterium JC017]
MKLLKKLTNKQLYLTIILFLTGLLYWFCLPSPLFNKPYCLVATGCYNELLGAHIAKDGQWRFPAIDSVPNKFEKSLLLFEDEYFYYHPGFNPVSLLRATFQNITNARIISGGSTITMQVIRLSSQHKRNFTNKLIELIQATRLELSYSKKEILNLYASNAPFGGNVVGIEAASWRYFGRPSHQLSWSESTLLAVLPNAPSLIHPGKNRDLLLKKRNRLLHKLLENQLIDSLTYDLSVAEPLPLKPLALPRIAPHLLTRLMKQQDQKKYETTIDGYLQERANQVVASFHAIYRHNEIHNAAAIILDNETGNVLAYVGNTPARDKYQGHEVDIITASRSTGSILKPFLYAAAINDGQILPHMLIPDVPTYYMDFAPKNYNKQFEGAVAAHTALSRSLNVPAVRMLDDYGIEKFIHTLNNVGIASINKPASYYGLSLILGGAEASLWEISGAYASLARVLNHFNDKDSRYFKHDIHTPIFLQKNKAIASDKEEVTPSLSAASIYYTFDALTNTNRPVQESGWQTFSSSRKVAWKTGTSYGYRDAWAVGVTPEYTVAVWVGNATGEGRPGIIGGSAASPIMFDLFRLLPQTSWFTLPYDDTTPALICRTSGFKAGPDCPATDTLYLPETAAPKPVCPYHKLIHLSNDEKYRVTAQCYPVSEMVHKSWFILPPVMEWYYKTKNFSYKSLPPYKKGCYNTESSSMEIIYPKKLASVYIPLDMNGSPGRIVLKATHRKPSTTIFWHLDDQYIGETKEIHQLEIFTQKGWHKITLIDTGGNSLSRWFNCLGTGHKTK